MALGVQWERYYVWADPRCFPPGAKVADYKVAAQIREGVRNAFRVISERSVTSKVTSREEFEKALRWLTYHGPSVRRSVLVVIDAPERKPTRYWHASVKCRKFLGRSK